MDGPDGLTASLAAAAILGRHVDRPDLGLAGVIVQDWESPSFSPLILYRAEPPSSSLLAELEERFKREPITNTYLTPKPYLLIPVSTYGRDPMAFDAALARRNWIVEADPLSFNRIRPPKALVPPPELEIHLADAGHAPLALEYRALLARSFRVDELQLDSISQVYRTSASTSTTVSVHDKAGALLAAGTVSSGNGTAILTWGTVDEAHRGRDLHRLLIAGCVTIAASHGAGECWLATRNPRVLHKWDGHVDLVIARAHALTT